MEAEAKVGADRFRTKSRPPDRKDSNSKACVAAVKCGRHAESCFALHSGDGHGASKSSNDWIPTTKTSFQQFCRLLQKRKLRLVISRRAYNRSERSFTEVTGEQHHDRPARLFAWLREYDPTRPRNVAANVAPPNRKEMADREAGVGRQPGRSPRLAAGRRCLFREIEREVKAKTLTIRAKKYTRQWSRNRPIDDDDAKTR